MARETPRIIYAPPLASDSAPMHERLGANLVVRWQAPTRNRRTIGFKFAAPALALAGAAIILADRAGHLELGGAVALAPLLLILPWAGMTVVSVVRSSLNWAAD